MDEKPRREEQGGNHRRESDRAEPDQRADSNGTRDRGANRPGLTEREREERWPVG